MEHPQVGILFACHVNHLVLKSSSMNSLVYAFVRCIYNFKYRVGIEKQFQISVSMFWFCIFLLFSIIHNHKENAIAVTALY